MLFRTPPSHLNPARSFRLTLDLSKSADIIIRSRPIRWIMPPPDRSPERGIRPVGCPRDKPVFDRIEMDIVRAAFEIAVIANGMLPKTPLPKGVFASIIA